MNNGFKIGSWEGISLIVNLISMQVFLNFPRTMIDGAGTAGWIQSMYVSVLVIIIFVILSKLYKNFNGKDIIEISEYLGGTIGRIVTGTLFAAYICMTVPIILREFGEHMKTVALPNSPISFILLFFIGAIITGSLFGIQMIARLTAIAVPLISIGYISILLGVSSYFDFSNIFPLLGSGSKAVFIDGMGRVSIYGAISVIFLIPHQIANPKIIPKVGFISLAVSGVFLTAGTLAYILVFEYPTNTQFFLPIYNMAKKIQYRRFYQRVEAIFVFSWASAGMLYLSTSFYTIILYLKKAFKLEYIRPLIFPTAIIVYTLSLYPSSLMETINYEQDFFRRFGGIITFGMPFLVFGLASIKKKIKGR